MKFVFFFLAGISFFQLNAQEDTEPDMPSTVIRINSNNLYGRVLEGSTSKGVEAVSVQLFARNRNNQDSLVAAMFTRPNGDFRFTDLPAADSFRLLITAVGYGSQELQVDFATVAGNKNDVIAKDLGNIPLQHDVQTLQGVVVTSQRSALEMGIDRRVFNVDRSLTATGGTAVDVMKNIPSVTVDVEGNVQLRNSSPQIFVDGRPTILTLDQIPADNIERVEVITNPSAKFDAASTGGIINVVLKRNKRVGFNGVVSAGLGDPDILNGNLNGNLRQGKFNFFVSSSYNQSGGRTNGEVMRQNKDNGIVTNYFNQISESERTRRFYSLRFGLDYFLDNRNTISLTQGSVRGRFKSTEDQDQEFLGSNRLLERYGARSSEGRSEFNRYNTQLNYSHKFPDPGKELSASVNYNYGNGENRSNILNLFYNPDGSEFSAPALVRNEGGNNNDQLTAQVDFENPISEDARLETGLRSYINNFQSRFASFAQNNGSEVLLPLSNNIAYREVVNAFYFTYSNRIESFVYQAGLRAEYSKFEGKLLDTGKEFGYTYPNKLDRLFDALFPSLFLTKHLAEGKELQLNYTRRIRRPNFWQLNPFVDINDPVNLNRGNPELRPEFTNSFEANYSQDYSKGNFLGAVYYSNNQHDITRYSDTISTALYQQLNNAAVDPNAILNTFINAQATNSLGAEATLQHRFAKNFDITPTMNIEYQKVKARVGDLDLSNEGWNWEAKLITNYKIENAKPLWNNLSFQLIGEYESPRIMPQGRQLPEYSVDLALRKEFLKDRKATITFSVNDIFWTDRDGAIYDTEQFYQESFRRNVRSFRLNFSYKFGNTDFQLFHRNGRGEDDDD
jgi:outer membrane receptor protein involved in Fe transport